MEIVSLQYNIALRWKILRLATPKKGGLFFIYIIEIWDRNNGSSSILTDSISISG